MKIETKFDIGQEVYYFEWSDILGGFYVRSGKIVGVYYNKVHQLLYKVNERLHLPSLFYITREEAEAKLKEIQDE